MTRIWRIALPAVLAHLCGRLISQTLPATLAHEASVISSWSYAICRPTTGKWSDRLQVAAFLSNTHCLHRFVDVRPDRVCKRNCKRTTQHRTAPGITRRDYRSRNCEPEHTLSYTAIRTVTRILELENRCTGNRTVGSNPTLSATLH